MSGEGLTNPDSRNWPRGRSKVGVLSKFRQHDVLQPIALVAQKVRQESQRGVKENDCPRWQQRHVARLPWMTYLSSRLALSGFKPRKFLRAKHSPRFLIWVTHRSLYP